MLMDSVLSKDIEKRRILSVGHMQFPLGFAQVQRQLLIAKAIELGGLKVTVLCRYGIHNKSDGIESEGIFEGVHYVYCSGTSVRPDNFFKRNLLKFRGLYYEFFYYRKFSKARQLAGIIVSTNSFHNILFYYLLGKIFKVITVVDNVEYWTSNKKFKGFERIDKLLYDRYYYHFSDKVICISDFLISKVRKSSRKILKLPAVTDFDRFDNNKDIRRINGKYFLYCGSDAYHEVLDFVVSSFEKSLLGDIMLILVTKDTEEIKLRIDSSSRKRLIRILTNVPYDELIDLYLNSEALIIPMRNTMQDIARFPHKISEYCASRRPIITNKVGEISNFFNETNAYLCSDYNEQEYAGKLAEVISDPEKAQQKSKDSYELGLRMFNYKAYSKILTNFLTEK